MAIIEEVEEKLGGTLYVLRDTLDLAIRQGDERVIKALRDIEAAWQTTVLLATTERKAKKDKLYFNAVQDGNSVIDALHHYGCEMFPNSTEAKRCRVKGG